VASASNNNKVLHNKENLIIYNSCPTGLRGEKRMFMKNFKNTSNNWQVWVNVFCDTQRMVLEGNEKECEKFVQENNANQSDIYGSIFMIAPHTGVNEDWSKLEYGSKTISLGTKNDATIYATDCGDNLSLLTKSDLEFCSPDFVIKFDSGVYPSVNDIDQYMCNKAFDTLNR